MTSWTLCAVVLATQLVSVAPQNVQIIPLNDETDPVQVIQGQLDVSDPLAPAIRLTLVNKTKTVVQTGDVWVNTERFFTRDEMRKNGNNIALDCGFMTSVDERAARADAGERAHDIPPGDAVVVTIPIPLPCPLNHPHEHFFAYVQQISTSGRYGNVVWQRELGDALRLLLATPHQ